VTPALHAALRAVRGGAPDVAGGAYPYLAPIEQLRLELALALRAGDRAAAADCAAILWEEMAVDPTVLATLVACWHPELGRPAQVLLERTLADATRDLAPAWQALAADPGALDGWRDVIGSLVANGSPLQAVDGVARALAEGAGGRELRSLLMTILRDYRQGDALDEALGLGEPAM
jgi:hypothetical protein